MQWWNRNAFIKFYFIGTRISSISLQQEIIAMVKQNCLYKVLLHRNLIPSISLQQEISAMVKQKDLYKVLLHRELWYLLFLCNKKSVQWWNRNVFIKFYFIGTLIPSISLQQEISAIVKQYVFIEVYFIKTLIPSISLQQKISAMVKQKCLYRVLLHRNSDIFYFYATRNQCNGETEMSL